MRTNDGSARHGVETSPPTKDTTKEAGAEGAPRAALLVPAALAVGAGGVVLVIAIAWGAAEAAVAVGAGYLVYSAITARGDLSGMLAVRLLTGALRGNSPPPPSGGPRID
jgi:hypothetical protein